MPLWKWKLVLEHNINKVALIGIKMVKYNYVN
ncbi:hypothetical protein M642_14200 [Listeria monocytogenes]|nr:hypothetical protein M642_14200 [Listeria monocytogenes]PIL17026.1 hypothetical protein P734_00400 [Listeria monocytogenes SHL017]